MKFNWHRFHKLIPALVAGLGIAVSQGLVVGTAAKWVAVGFAVAGALGVGLTPANDPA